MLRWGVFGDSSADEKGVGFPVSGVGYDRLEEVGEVVVLWEQTGREDM
jgi:hypothetical protein